MVSVRLCGARRVERIGGYETECERGGWSVVGSKTSTRGGKKRGVVEVRLSVGEAIGVE